MNLTLRFRERCCNTTSALRQESVLKNFSSSCNFLKFVPAASPDVVWLTPAVSLPGRVWASEEAVLRVPVVQCGLLGWAVSPPRPCLAVSLADLARSLLGPGLPGPRGPVWPLGLGLAPAPLAVPLCHPLAGPGAAGHLLAPLRVLSGAASPCRSLPKTVRKNLSQV